jgi:adenine phosphoribosyltransferase
MDFLKTLVRAVPDFPIPGIVFRDIAPLLADAGALRRTVELLAEPYRDEGVQLVAGIESRGFIFGAPLALALGAGFVPVRKLGKLPGETIAQSYALEYGANHLEVQRDAIADGQRVLLLDDVLATGGTAAASARLVTALGGTLVGAAFVIELEALAGRRLLPSLRVTLLLTY